MDIRFPDEAYIEEAFDQAERRLLSLTGRCFLLELDERDESGGVISSTRDDGAQDAFVVYLAGTVAPMKLTAFERCQRDRHYFDQRLSQLVGLLASGPLKDEAEPEPTPELANEQRFAVVLAFGSRPDVVLTPEHGVPPDEAVRVYQSFLTAAATIGGRPAMLPLGA